MKDMTHLSVVDGAFLRLESPEMPMHVGSLALFERPEDDDGQWFERLKSHVASRMHLAPVSSRKLALMPFDLANLVWIPDDDIDMDYHVRYLVLNKPGTMAQLEGLAARLHSSLLDRSRPLWEFYVIDGLESGRIGFYSKVHHSAVDGQAAVAMGNSVFDVSPEPRRVKPPRPARSNRYQLGVAELLSAAVGNQLRQVVELTKLLPPLATAAIGAAKSAIAAKRSGEKSTKAHGTRFKFAPATPFNTSITHQRSFSVVSTGFPLLGSPWLLSGLASLYGRSRIADWLRLANVTISNVPGPQVPLYLAGAKMVGIYPVSIVVHGVALHITVQSYMGQLCFGLITCRRAVPDANKIIAQLELEVKPGELDKAEIKVPVKAKSPVKLKPRLTVVGNKAKAKVGCA